MRDTPGPATGDRFETDVPSRLDRLPWSGFHWRVVIALGITWVLDGLEVTLVGSLAGAIHQSPSLALISQIHLLPDLCDLVHVRYGGRRSRAATLVHRARGGKDRRGHRIADHLSEYRRQLQRAAGNHGATGGDGNIALRHMYEWRAFVHVH